MKERSVRRTARRAALDAQAAQRRERRERDRRLDALAVDVLVTLGERDAAERRAGQLLQTMIDREQLSLRRASPGSATRFRSASPRDCSRTPTKQARRPTRIGAMRVCGRRIDPAGRPRWRIVADV